MDRFQLYPFRIVSTYVDCNPNAVDSFAAGGDASVAVNFDRSLYRVEVKAIGAEYQRIRNAGGQLYEFEAVGSQISFTTKDDELPLKFLAFIVDQSEAITKAAEEQLNATRSTMQGLDKKLQRFVAF